ncbi:MAG TPA: sialidase family protein [bacterium]|nr:sialidase family protein [bacterium]HQO33633.1 sialidase family protein [bacterium]HQP98195.1 sialidase family protein [bacterium]
MNRTILLLVLLSIPCISMDAEPLFEIQTAVASKGPSHWCAYACAARLNDGRILCVYSDCGDRIAGIFSDDGIFWSEPVSLIDSPVEADYDPNIVVVGDRVFVLSTTRMSDEIIRTTTWCARSEDNGKTWSKPYVVVIPHTYTSGKVQPGIQLKSGRLLFPYSWDLVLEEGSKTVRGEGEMDSQAGVMISDDQGDTWRLGGDVHVEVKADDKKSGGAIFGADEPALMELSDGSIYMIMRTGTDRMWETWSRDGGETWDPPRPSSLVAHNTPATLCKLERENVIVCVWNESPTNRWPLVAAVSKDECRTWSKPKMLACVPGLQSSYPGSAVTRDGLILAFWQQQRPNERRDIIMARFNLEWLLAQD